MFTRIHRIFSFSELGQKCQKARKPCQILSTSCFQLGCKQHKNNILIAWFWQILFYLWEKNPRKCKAFLVLRKKEKGNTGFSKKDMHIRTLTSIFSFQKETRSPINLWLRKNTLICDLLYRKKFCFRIQIQTLKIKVIRWRSSV